MKQAKLVGAAVLVMLVVIIVLQNTQSIETKILFMTITMPRAIMLIAAGVIGFLIGLLTALRIGSPGKNRRSAD